MSTLNAPETSIKGSVDSVDASPVKCRATYGFPTWAYFLVVLAINAGFFATQLLVNGVRTGQVPVSTLDALLYPGAYWNIVTLGMIFLMFAGFLLGLTVAVIVVRAWLHYTPCRYYGWVLVLQLLPWLYFISALP